MEVFAISPASTRPLWFLGIVCAILALVLIALAYTAYSSRNSRVEIHGDRLKLVGDFWGREIPFTLLQVDKARIVDLGGKSGFLPRRRTFGTGLPGYASGWFKLHSGEKALVYLTNRDKGVYLPTTDGYSLLLSIEEPERFIASLQNFFHNGSNG